LSSSFLSKNLKTKIFITIILPVVLYGCETWWFKLREKRRLKVFENRMPRRIFRPKLDEVTREKKNYITRNLMISNPHPNVVGLTYEEQ
jgi:hypothetical protein